MATYEQRIRHEIAGLAHQVHNLEIRRMTTTGAERVALTEEIAAANQKIKELHDKIKARRGY